MIKIKNINLILLLSFLNNNLNSMQPSYLKESVNIEQDLNPIQVSDSEKNKPIEEDSVLLNLPEEIIQSIIHKITEPYIDKIKNIDNVFELYSIDIEQFKKKLKKELINLSLTSKRLRHSVLYFIEYRMRQIEAKRQKLTTDILFKYKNLDKEMLNNRLKNILNKRSIILEDLEEATKLIIAGANIEIKNSCGWTILMLATRFGHENVIKLLLGKGANVNVRDKCGQTALILASIKGHKNIIKLLLNRGADVNARDSSNYTALIEVPMQSHHKDIVELLLNRGADVNAEAEDGNTALIKAATQGNQDIVKLLLKRGANINARDNDGETALIWATFRGHKDVVRLLINMGASINVINNDGKNALMIAVQKGRKDIVELLLAAGANINTINNDNETALIIALEKGHVDIVRLLLNKGADIKTIDEYDNIIF